MFYLIGREHGLPISKLTHEVVTLWYRPPEILLGQEKYSGACDMWGVGCIIAEMGTRQALFTGDCEIDQLFQIFQILGTPNEDIWPGVTSLPDFKNNFPQWKSKDLNKKLRNRFDLNGIDLIKKLLLYPPNKRITAKKALLHPWFDDIRDIMIKKFDIFYKKQDILFNTLKLKHNKIKNSIILNNNNNNNNNINNNNIDQYNENNQENLNPNQNNTRMNSSYDNNNINNKNNNNNTKHKPIPMETD